MAQTPASVVYWFDHEKLDVYQESIALVAWVVDVVEGVQGAADIKDHLDRASSSVSLNIAEGNGKYSMKDRSRFLENSMTSALECAGALDVLVAKRKLTGEQITHGKVRLQKIVRMLMGLIKRNNARDYPAKLQAGS
jgi:four helix bundle protein